MIKSDKMLTLAGIPFKENEIELAFASGKRFIVKWKTIWQICYSQAQRRYYSIKVLASEDSYVCKGRFYIVNAEKVNEMIGSEIFID